MRRSLLNTARESRTWPKFIGAVCLIVAVLTVDEYMGMAATVAYLLTAAVFLRGLAKRYLIAAVGVSFFAATALFFGYVKTGVPAWTVLILPLKILTLAWVSAYFYTITSPTTLVTSLARLNRPLEAVGLRAGFWTTSLGFAISALPVTRRTAAEVVTAARLRGASTAKIGRRLKIAGLATANVLTGVFDDAVTRADAIALRGGTFEAATGRRGKKPVGLTTIFAPALILIITITIEIL
jgi:energy-coupling factor transporter transmembrane protein EcfT